MIVTSDGKDQPEGLIYSPEMVFCGSERTALYFPESTCQSGYTRFGQSSALIPVNHVPIFRLKIN